MASSSAPRCCVHERDGARTASARQEAVLAFLGHEHRNCKRVDTHASIVFLGKDRVLKVKRAVRLPFLDYSTLGETQAGLRRRTDRQQPLRAGALSPRRSRSRRARQDFEIGGDGPTIEWAVEMARFDEEQDLRSSGARQASITPELADALAVTIRDDAPARCGLPTASSWLASVAGIIDRNTQTFRDEAAACTRTASNDCTTSAINN